MPKNKHAQALGKLGGEVRGGAKAEAAKANLSKVSPASRIANAEKARAAKAAKRLAKYDRWLMESAARSRAEINAIASGPDPDVK